MALTEDEIRINYKKAIEKSEELEQVANKLESMISDKFEAALSIITNNWEGKNADMFIIKCKKEISKLYIVIDNFRNSAKIIRSIAEEYKLAEINAIEIIEMLGL
ncbi:MAG: hypothetical protein ACI4L2_09300 [Wujia sp.]